jgi:TolB-like protein
MIKASVIFIALFGCLVSQAQKVKEHSEVITELVEKIEGIKPVGKQFRIAVVPFVCSNPADASKAFGEYLTESITGKLSEKPQVFKVFERQRLDAVFKENELMLSGMMKPSEALKIGQLLPLDALFSGTYTKLKTYVEVSGRLIDVASGEIMTSYSGRIKMSKNIKTLFDAPAATPVTQTNPQTSTPAKLTIINQITPSQQAATKSKEEICKLKVAAFRVYLEDLSTPEKINTAVAEGMKTPFDNQCGQLHDDLIYSLTRYHLYPVNYKRFLAATLDTIAFPANDERAYEICRYWDDDKHIDEEEWRSGFAAMRKVGNYSLSSYVSYLIGRTEDATEQLKDRINQLMTLAQNQKLGLPRPMAYNDAFFEVWEGLDKNLDLKIYLYETFSKNLTLDGKYAPKIFSKLNGLYKDSESQQDKSKVINWLIRFFNDYSFEKSHEELYELAFAFQLTTNESTNQRIRKEYPAPDLKILVDQCKSRFTEYALLSPYNSQKEDRINFCAQNSIAVPGVIPTMAEADNILKGQNLDEQLRVTKLMVQMKEVSKTLEPTLIALLDRKSLDDKEKMTAIQSLETEVLGHLKTSSPRAIERMTQMVTSFNYQEADRAKAALVEIGKPAVQPLIKKLQTTSEQDDGLRYQIILMLGKIGKDAKPAEATLKNLLQKTTNSDVRYVIEATLDAIK